MIMRDEADECALGSVFGDNNKHLSGELLLPNVTTDSEK